MLLGNKSQLTVGNAIGGDVGERVGNGEGSKDVEGSKERDGMNDGIYEGTIEILGASDGKHSYGKSLSVWLP